MKPVLVIASLGVAVTAAAALRLAAAPALPPPHAGPGDVTAVRVLPVPGRAELVVEVRGGGAVRVSDFMLRDPARLVLDLVGARLVAPLMQYDGVERGGIRDVRYAQFRPDVVRVVLELDQARDYQLRQDSAGVHVAFAASQAFAACVHLMCEGEMKQIEKRHHFLMSETEYLKIIHQKTAALFQAACMGGAYLAGADQTVIDPLGAYGLGLGMAFQIVDDITDKDGLGKSRRNHRDRRYKSGREVLVR